GRAGVTGQLVEERVLGDAESGGGLLQLGHPQAGERGGVALQVGDVGGDHLAALTAVAGDQVHLGGAGQAGEQTAAGEGLVVGVGEHGEHPAPLVGGQHRSQRVGGVGRRGAHRSILSHLQAGQRKAVLRRDGQAFRRAALCRSWAFRITLRMRTASGVTSTHSSSRANSSDSSRVRVREGVRFSNVSAVAERMLFSFFSLVMFTSMSSPRAFSPTIMPSYTSSVGWMKKVPRSCRFSMANGVATPARSATREPVVRNSIGPAHGSNPSAMEAAMPVPRVSVRKRVRKPIRPRAGTRNSIRTQPVPWLAIVAIRPLRAASSWVTAPRYSS